MEKEKKKISCSYALLVVILFAVVCFLVDYIVIDRKLNENKGGSSTNSDVSENANNGNDSSNVSSNSNVQYTYDNIAGKYVGVEKVYIDSYNEQKDLNFKLELYMDGTYSFMYSIFAVQGELGNYYIDGNKIILNKFFDHYSDVGVHVSYGSNELIIENDKILINNYMKNINSQQYSGNLVLNKESNFTDVDNENSVFKSRLSYGILVNDSYGR